MEVDREKYNVKGGQRATVTTGKTRSYTSTKRFEEFKKAEPVKFKKEVKSRIKQLQEKFMWEKSNKELQLELEIEPIITELEYEDIELDRPVFDKVESKQIKEEDQDESKKN